MIELIERMAEVLPPKPIGENPLSFVVTPVHAAEMHNRLARLAAALEAALEDADRWRFVTNELSEAYGDGNTEPHECHVHLEWVQGPWIRDGSNGGRGRPDTFPGWNAIVDAKIAQHRLDYDDLDAAIDQARGKGGGEGRDGT